MKNLVATDTIKTKLKTKHGVELNELEQYFYNKAGRLLTGNRDLHKTIPPTLWFIALTHKGRQLKVTYIQIGLEIHLKTAYEPNEAEKHIYQLYG